MSTKCRRSPFENPPQARRKHPRQRRVLPSGCREATAIGGNHSPYTVRSPRDSPTRSCCRGRPAARPKSQGPPTVACSCRPLRAIVVRAASTIVHGHHVPGDGAGICHRLVHAGLVVNQRQLVLLVLLVVRRQLGGKGEIDEALGLVLRGSAQHVVLNLEVPVERRRIVVVREKQRQCTSSALARDLQRDESARRNDTLVDLGLTHLGLVPNPF